MMNATATVRRTLIWALPLLLVSPPALGQMDLLRQRDDQFIQGLREQGMSDLLDRFVEQVGDQDDLDPIAKLQLIIAQQEFSAKEKLDLAIALSGDDPERYTQRFLESREAYEALIAAQQQLIADNNDDERVPIWQTDLAAMLLDTYLPTYWNNAVWFYEFGVYDEGQAEAFERSVALAFEMTADARSRIEDLTGRMGRDGGVLRSELEDMGIYYKLREDYGKRLTPFWFAHSAFYVALLPDSQAYYQTLGPNNGVRNQAPTPDAERARLLQLVDSVATGSLMSDAQMGTMLRLLAGRAMVASGDADRADDGVADYLDTVIDGSQDTWQGYLASLAKARGRAVAGEMDTATRILRGMDRNAYVTQELGRGNITPRLLAADLLHRMLLEPAEQARGADRRALMAEAYEMPYLALINEDGANRFAPVLYQRWSAQVGQDTDPASLPPMVRMGVGQMKAQAGAAIARDLIHLAINDPTDNYPRATVREQEVRRRAQLRTQADADLRASVVFNETIATEETDDSVRDRGLMNLAFSKYFLAELAKMYGGDEGAASSSVYFEIAQLWATIGIEMPDSPQAEQATANALSLLQQFDRMTNTGPQGVTNALYRDAFRAAAEAMYANWPNHDIAHGMRVYTAYYVYELSNDLEQAIEVYRGLPPAHVSYFEARRQMILAMQKRYDTIADEIHSLEMAGPDEDTEEAREALGLALAQRHEDLGRLRRELLDTAKFLEIEAEDEAEHTDDLQRRFSATTAQAGAIVAIAAMEADNGETGAAIERLVGYEDRFRPNGALADLVARQPNSDNAVSQLDGLIQSAQERRILAMVNGADLDDPDDLAQIGNAAETMIADYPDVAAGVVNGVLRRIEAQIESLEEARARVQLATNRERVENSITKLAGVAVQLSELLVKWAIDEGYTGSRLLPFELGMCRALLLGDQAGEAVPVMEKWLEEFPNNFEVAMLAGDCIIADARQRGVRSAAVLDPGLRLYYKIILFHNAQPGVKPARFWSAWLKVLETMEYAGGDLRGQIGDKVRMLQNRVDEDLGGDQFRDPILEIYRRNPGN